MTTTAAAPTVTERQALTEMVRLFEDAKGAHSALAGVRSAVAAKMDELIAILKADGVDTDALLDEIDEELGL